MTVGEVAEYLRVPRKKVLSLPIARIELSPRRVRFRDTDVFAFTNRHVRRL